MTSQNDNFEIDIRFMKVISRLWSYLKLVFVARLGFYRGFVRIGDGIRQVFFEEWLILPLLFWFYVLCFVIPVDICQDWLVGFSFFRFLWFGCVWRIGYGRILFGCFRRVGSFLIGLVRSFVVKYRIFRHLFCIHQDFSLAQILLIHRFYFFLTNQSPYKLIKFYLLSTHHT